MFTKCVPHHYSSVLLMADFITLLVSNTRPGHPLDPYHIVQVIPLSGNIKEHILTDGTPRPLGVNATARLVTPTVINKQTIREFIIYYVVFSAYLSFLLLASLKSGIYIFFYIFVNQR